MGKLISKTGALAAMVIWAAMLVASAGVWAQGPGHLTQMMVRS
jgi:hypothetical protein